MADFYAYFEPTVTDRVGGGSAEAARGTTTDPFKLLQRVKQPHGAFPRVSGSWRFHHRRYPRPGCTPRPVAGAGLFELTRP